MYFFTISSYYNLLGFVLNFRIPPKVTLLIVTMLKNHPTKDHQKVPRATFLDNLKFTLWNDNAG